MSTSGGVWKALQRGCSIHCEVVQVFVNLSSYWNEQKAHETGVVPILSGYTLWFRRGREERCQAQFL